MTTEVLVPNLPESVTDATVVSWHKQPGDPVRRGENLVDLETDKVVLEVPALTDGTMGELRKLEGDTVTAGEVLATLAEGAATPPAQPQAAATSAEPPPALSPSVRRAIAETNVDPASVAGTGPDGRITRPDIMRAADGQTKTEQAPVPPPPAISEDGRPEQRVPMTRLRARVAERLLQVQQTAAILTTFNEVDLQAVMDIRSRHKERFEKAHKTRLGFMSFFVKATVDALKRFPVVNASVDDQEIVYHGYFDIGIAVGSPRGLVVPILRDADQLGFAEIEQRITDFGERAQAGSLSYDELSGGTFTISNGGVFGSMLSTPILNPPQSAILGMHNIQQRPVARDGQVVIRPMMYLALSYDHRIIDGREAVQFLVHIKTRLEDPTQLLLEI